ncbi:MAG: tetratricopeptide repeat protein [Vicinamibacterales bacterium]
MPEQHPRIEDLRRRVLKDPASIAFAQLAEEYRRAGALEDAVEVCRAGLARHPGYLSARVTLGRALLDLGQLDAAYQELRVVLTGAPDNLPAIRGLADILHRRGRLREALAHYRRALGLARNDPDLQQTVVDLTRQVGQVAAPAGATAAAAAPLGPQSDAGGLLTLEQLTQELERAATRVAASASSSSAAPAPSGPSRESDAADRQLLARLERWVTAIDGFRAERRA